MPQPCRRCGHPRGWLTGGAMISRRVHSIRHRCERCDALNSHVYEFVRVR